MTSLYNTLKPQGGSYFPSSGVNNPIALISQDNPLGAGTNVIAALSAKDNMYEYIGSELLAFKNGGIIDEDAVNHRLEFVLATQMVAAESKVLLEHPFGFAISAAMTEEPISAFTLSFHYLVDNTEAATECAPTGGGTMVDMIKVGRKVVTKGPGLRCSFQVNKQVHAKFTQALKGFAGVWLSDADKLALGIDIGPSPLEESKLHIVKTEYNNFQYHVAMKQQAASRSLARGAMTKVLDNMTFLSPSIYSFPVTLAFNGVKDRKEIALMINTNYQELLFGINKLGPVPNSERLSSMDSFNQVIKLFHRYTDNTGVDNETKATFDTTPGGVPFLRPDVILTATDDVIDELVTQGIAHTATASSHQYTRVLSITKNDTSPYTGVAPQDSLHMEGGQWRRNPDGGLCKQRFTSNDQKIYYGKLGNKYNAIFVPIDDASFAKTAPEDAQYLTMTQFDTFMPSAVTICEGDRPPIGPSRQSVTFVNENGVAHTMCTSRLKAFLANFFMEGGNAMLDEDQVEGGDDDDVVPQEKSLIFFRCRKPRVKRRRGGVDGAASEETNRFSLRGPETPSSSERNAAQAMVEREQREALRDALAREGVGRASSPSRASSPAPSSSDSSGDDEDDGDGGRGRRREKKVFYRNKYMADNFYFNTPLMCNNIISVLDNEADPDLYVLIQQVRMVPDTWVGEDSREGLVSPADENDEADVAKDGLGARRVNSFNLSTIIAVVDDYYKRNGRGDKSKAMIKRAFWVLYNLTNEEAVDYLGHINMGFGILWLLPKFVMSGSVGLARPGVFQYFNGKPSTSKTNDMSNETENLNYTSVGQSSVSRLSFMNPGLLWRNAHMLGTQAVSTNKMAPIMEPHKLQQATKWLRAMKLSGMKEKTLVTTSWDNGWWPLFIQPHVDKAFFESPNSPLGRMASHFKTREDFTQQFTDKRYKDIKFPDRFTMNTVFTHINRNFNTIFLYREEIFRDEDFPFAKYQTFNANAAAAVTDMLGSITRARSKSQIMGRQDDEAIEPTNMNHSSVSDTLGAALPKCCYTSSNIHDGGVLNREDNQTARSYRTTDVILKDTSFFITGSPGLDKFDRQRVSHASFVR